MALVEMKIDSIRLRMVDYQRVIILKTISGDRYLNIWTGPAEADAIAVALEGVETPRPLPHDLMYSLITELGSELKCVIIDDIKKEVYKAKLVITAEDRELLVDCRPSDAIALAVRANVPIYTEDSVLKEAGIPVVEIGEDPDTEGK